MRGVLIAALFAATIGIVVLSASGWSAAIPDFATFSSAGLGGSPAGGPAAETGLASNTATFGDTVEIGDRVQAGSEPTATAVPDGGTLAAPPGDRASGQSRGHPRADDPPGSAAEGPKVKSPAASSHSGARRQVSPIARAPAGQGRPHGRTLAPGKAKTDGLVTTPVKPRKTKALPDVRAVKPQSWFAAGRVGPRATCEALDDIACEETVRGDTSPLSSTIDRYDCVPGWDESGPEMVYKFTPDRALQVTAELSELQNDLDLFVLEGLGAVAACLPSDPVGFALTAPGGVTYFIVVDGYGGVEGTFVLDVTCQPLEEGACCVRGECTNGVTELDCLRHGGTWFLGKDCADVVCPEPCDITCDASSVPEDEPDCGLPIDTVNGGCNSTPYIFSKFMCGETVCGTAAYEGDVRDTDWYEITVDGPTRFTWKVTAEFAFNTFILMPGPDPDPCAELELLAGEFEGQGEACDTVVLSACVGPGTYWFFVAPDFDGPAFPCDLGLEYEATLGCNACTAGACCLSSGVCAILGVNTCEANSGIYLGDGTDCDPNCCVQPFAGADDCPDPVVRTVPVDGTPVPFSGNNSNATGPDACPNDLVTWWEAFTIGACADVVIDYCCTDPMANTVYRVVTDDCQGCNLLFDDAESFQGTLPGCADGNFRGLWESLGEGTYYYPVYSDQAGSLSGPYQLHVTAYPCTSGACCRDGVCLDTMSRLRCEATGGEWFAGEDCNAGYVCPGAGCDVTSDGKDCLAVSCPEVGHQCLPQIIHMDNSSGTPKYTVESCECQSPNECHVAIDSPDYVYCAGGCEAEERCELIEIPVGVNVMAYECRCVSVDCAPNENNSACQDVPCPVDGQECLPRCANFNPETGARSIVDCDCRFPNDCHLEAASPRANPCVVPDNGTGTVTLPPQGCEYLSPDEVHLIIDGLPAGTTIELAPIHKDFICLEQPGGVCTIPLPPGECEGRGGSLGGHGDCFESALVLDVNGTGSLAGFNRSLVVPIRCEVHTGPRNPGDAVQAFPTEMFRLQGELFGDPDFCTLKVTGGRDFGLPGPGHTTLTALPSGDYAVDSFFDITYQIEFEGCTGSRLAGYAGVTTATLRMETGSGTTPPACVGGCPPGRLCNRSIAAELADGTVDVCCDCVPQPPGCEPTADWLGCEEVDCPVAGDRCVPTTIRHDVRRPFFPPAGIDELRRTTGFIVLQQATGATETYDITGAAPNVTRVLRNDPHEDGTHQAVDAEIIEMELLAVGAASGMPLLVQLSETSSSLGKIVGTDDSMTDYPADSFFDVFVTIDIPDLPGAQGLWHDEPIKLRATGLMSVPPWGSVFRTPAGWNGVALLDTNGEPTGSRIIEVVHALPPPPPEWYVVDCDCLPDGACHVGFRPSDNLVWCEGGCPSGYACELIKIDTDGDDVIDVYRCKCETRAEACCLPDGTCVEVRPEDCAASTGVPQGPGTMCEGDANNNGINDACEDGACEDCGPGYHWVDTCPGGLDNMPTAGLVGIDINLDCRPDTNLVLSGPVYIRRSGARDDSMHYPGIAPVDGHLEVLDTEIISMSLTGGGVTLRAGAGLGQSGVLASSLGAIVERPANAAWADSFFDVFVEMDLGDGSFAYNHDPMRVTTVIDCLPPNRSYLHPSGCIPLYASADPSSAELIANLVRADHSTYPECGDPATGDCFTEHDPPYCDREKCCREVCAQMPECCVESWTEACAGLARQICPDAPIEIDQFDFSLGMLELRLADEITESVRVAGPTTVHVFFEGDTAGSADDDDGDGLDEVATEMVDLNLSGVSELLGPVHVRLHPGIPSLGQIEENENLAAGVLDLPPFGPPGTNADSFFDIYFEIEVLGQTFHTIDAKRMQGVITYKPPEPGNLYQSPEEIRLYDSDGNPTEYYLAAASHEPNPPMEVDIFPETVGQMLLEVPGPIITPNPQLPPTDGVYRSPAQVHAVYEGPGLQVVLQDIRHRPLSDPPPEVTVAGADEVEVFDSLVAGTAIVMLRGVPVDPVSVKMRGPVKTVVYGKADQTTGSFQAEIVAMELTGEIPGIGSILMREDPDRVSAGQVGIVAVVTDEGNDQFSVESFFDVFTELSVDGGQTWIPSTDSVPMELVQPHLVSAVGPAEVQVRFEGPHEGEAYDDDDDGFDEVDTRLVSMDLRGYTRQGPVRIGLQCDPISVGQIIEGVNRQPGKLEVAPFDTANIPAESFFDVWPEIRIGDQLLHTAASLLLKTLIAHKPPQDGERYVNPYLDPVELIDPVTGQGTGIFVVREVHQPAPTVERDLFPRTLAWIVLEVPEEEPFKVAMHGPSRVHVYFEGPGDGDAVDDDFNGRDEVVMEMKTLELEGHDPVLGDVYLRLNPDEVTLGQIEENHDVTTGVLDLPPFGPDGTTADSFFDVLFEVELPNLGLVLHNELPARMKGTITHKPPGPGDWYESVEEIELFDDFGNPTGVYLTTARNLPNPPEVVETYPPQCAIDARQPHPLDSLTPEFGWDRLVLVFNSDPAPLNLKKSDFSISAPACPCVPPAIADVITDSANKAVIVKFSRAIPTGCWTCVERDLTGQRWCMGALPADVDQSRVSIPPDVEALIDCINGVSVLPCEDFQTDIDRSGRLTAVDMLRAIDLLNGADAFMEWLGWQLGDCPREVQPD